MLQTGWINHKACKRIRHLDLFIQPKSCFQKDAWSINAIQKDISNINELLNYLRKTIKNRLIFLNVLIFQQKKTANILATITLSTDLCFFSAFFSFIFLCIFLVKPVAPKETNILYLFYYTLSFLLSLFLVLLCYSPFQEKE